MRLYKRFSIQNFSTIFLLLISLLNGYIKETSSLKWKLEIREIVCMWKTTAISMLYENPFSTWLKYLREISIYIKEIFTFSFWFHTHTHILQHDLSVILSFVKLSISNKFFPVLFCCRVFPQNRRQKKTKFSVVHSSKQ